MKVSEALKAEKEFFQNHPVYSAIPAGICGTEALTQKLTKVLFGHIRNTLPEITKEIIAKIKDCEDRLKDLGQPLPSSTKEKMQLIWNMCTDFVENFKNNIRGKFDQKRNAKVIKELSGGAKIKIMFGELYKEWFGKRPSEGISDDQIRKAITLHQGDSIPGFPSVDSFLFLLGPLLKRLKDPALDLLNNVHLYLEELTQELIDRIFFRFPAIIPDIVDITSRALKEERDTAQSLIENIIESEQTYIFTNDLAYANERSSIIPQVQASNDPKNMQKPVDPEQLFVNEIRNRIDTYFVLVLRNIRDSIPKTIGHFLVRAVQENLQYFLYNELNKNEQLMAMIGEPPHITAERETLNKVLDVLNKAKRVLTKDPDLAPQFNASEKSSFPQKSISEKPSSHTVVNASKNFFEEAKDLNPKDTKTQSTTQQQEFISNAKTTTNTTSNTSFIANANNQPNKSSDLFGGNSTISNPSSNSGLQPTNTNQNPFANANNRPEQQQQQQPQPQQQPKPKRTGLFG